MSQSRTVSQPLSQRELAAPNQGSVYFIGNATTILRYAGFTILTDPNFLHRGAKIPLGFGLHSTRLTEPAITIQQLPELDFALLSHTHEDHWDSVDRQRLDKALPIYTPPRAAETLHGQGFAAAEGIATWQSRTVQKGNASVRITAMPARHGPEPFSALMMPPTMGSLLEFEQPDGPQLRVYISGDTIVYDELREITRRYPRIDLALLHLGGTRIFGMSVTMTGRQGVQLLRMLNPVRAIPLHYDDYAVFKSPLEEFRRAVAVADLSHRVTYLSHGALCVFQVSPHR